MQTTMTRRKPRAKRNKSGRIIYDRKDYGTPEQAMRKAELTAGGDPALSTNALDRLLAHELITQEQRDAGQRFYRLRVLAYGRPHCKASQLSDHIREQLMSEYATEETEFDKIRAEAKQKYDELDNQIRKLGSRAHSAIQNVCIYDRFPLWAIDRTQGKKLNDARGFYQGVNMLEGWI